MAKLSTALLMLVVMLMVGATAGPLLLQSLTPAGFTILPTSAGSQPVVVNWSFMGHDGQREMDHPRKCGGRARWAEGKVTLSGACEAVSD